MITDSVGRARIDGRTKEEAGACPSGHGLVGFRRDQDAAGACGGQKGAAVRCQGAQCRNHRGDRSSGRRGDVASFKSVEELMADLNAEDRPWDAQFQARLSTDQGNAALQEY